MKTTILSLLSTAYLLASPLEASALDQQNLAMPVEGKITSVFGCRSLISEKGYRAFMGVNISNKLNTPVTAVADGKVVFSGQIDKTGWGNIVILEHPNNWRTYYAHQNSLSVETGDRVKQGQEIGKLGQTGLTTGVTISFLVSQGNEFFHPLKLIQQGKKSAFQEKQNCKALKPTEIGFSSFIH